METFMNSFFSFLAFLMLGCALGVYVLNVGSVAGVINVSVVFMLAGGISLLAWTLVRLMWLLEERRDKVPSEQFRTRTDAVFGSLAILLFIGVGLRSTPAGMYSSEKTQANSALESGLMGQDKFNEWGEDYSYRVNQFNIRETRDYIPSSVFVPQNFETRK